MCASSVAGREPGAREDPHLGDSEGEKVPTVHAVPTIPMNTSDLDSQWIKYPLDKERKEIAEWTRRKEEREQRQQQMKQWEEEHKLWDQMEFEKKQHEKRQREKQIKQWEKESKEWERKRNEREHRRRPHDKENNVGHYSQGRDELGKPGVRHYAGFDTSRKRSAKHLESHKPSSGHKRKQGSWSGSESSSGSAAEQLEMDRLRDLAQLLELRESKAQWKETQILQLELQEKKYDRKIKKLEARLKAYSSGGGDHALRPASEPTVETHCKKIKAATESVGGLNSSSDSGSDDVFESPLKPSACRKRKKRQRRQGHTTIAVVVTQTWAPTTVTSRRV